MKDEKNIFIAITPYTLSIAETLISNRQELIGKENILFNLHNLPFNKNIWSKVYSAKINRKAYNTFLIKNFNFLIGTIKTRFFYQRIKSLIGDNCVFNLYYVDLGHFFTNHIFFCCKNINKRFVIEDGLLNYYYHPFDVAVGNYKLKSWMLSLFNFKFKTLSKDVTGVELHCVDAQYVYAPNLSYFSSKSLQIPYEAKHYELIDNNVLILGQESLAKVIGNDKYLEILMQLLNFISNNIKLEEKAIYYKPHHHGVEEPTRSIIEKQFGSSLHYFQTKLPIENCIEEISPGMIFTFLSTSTINLKRLVPKQVDIYAFKSNNNKEIIDLFNKFSIKLISINGV